VVRSYELDGDTGSWEVNLPLPVIDRTVTVETEDVERVEPEYVKFVGRSSAMRVVGEHRIEPTDDGCRLHNEFVVDGRLPGVERFFKRRLDDELDNLEAALRRDLELPA
jgi:carbon monoxide dehydrogenase subunit G